jgi:hypothetical protein
VREWGAKVETHKYSVRALSSFALGGGFRQWICGGGPGKRDAPLIRVLCESVDDGIIRTVWGKGSITNR